MINKVWNFLNGNKTIICSLIFMILQQPLASELIAANWLTFWLWFFGASGVLSLAHHLAKDSFSQNYE